MKTKNLFTALSMMAVVLIAGCKKDTFTETIGLCPIVLSTNPDDGATNVPLTQIFTVKFNKDMNPKTITDASIYFEYNPKIEGTLTYNDSTATFTPTSPLIENTTYRGIVKTTVQDLKGNALQEDFLWSFSTGATIAPMPPMVISTDPADKDTGVALNKIISATFNMSMNPATLNNSTFTLKQGSNPIAGAVSYSGVTALFNPTVDFLPNTEYTATITTGAENPLGIAIDSNYVWTFTTGNTLLGPEVISTDPFNNETDVVLNKNITATFNMPMDPTTINGTTFTLYLGATPIAGAISYSGTTATFNPTNDLSPDTEYTATITTGAENLAGTSIANNYVWKFRTLTLTPPIVISTDPANNATGVVLNKNITATFNMAMNPTTINGTTFTLYLGATPIAGAVSYSGTTATFNPTNDLLPDTEYTATVTTGAQNLAGTGLASNYVWKFRTLALTPPIVTSTDPTNNATNVVLSKNITATFNMPMDPLTINGTTFTLKNGATPVAGAVSYSGTTATFNPTNDLLPNTVYTATITTGAQNLAGTPLANDYVWTFTTTGPSGPMAVDLDCAAGFAILAGSTVVNTGPTIVSGNLGLSPGTSVTGFPPGTVVNGSIQINSTDANAAKLCLTTAFNDAAGRSLDRITVPSGQLGGLTLAPGLYYSGISSFEITGSDLTLDAQGNADAVWIFQMPSSTLTVGNGIKVTLANGASADNIFWQVGSSATIGTTAEMKGNILADQSITLQTGAVLLGRALTRIAAVTLDDNAVTKP
jgi:hypothetical protein